MSALIRGRPFLRNDICLDARVFAETLLDKLGAPDGGEEVLFALSELAYDPKTESFIAAAKALREFGKRARPSWAPEATLVRCFFYAAVTGHQPASHEVAAYAVSLVHKPRLPASVVKHHAVAAVAWLLASTGQRPPPDGWSRSTAVEFLASVIEQPGPGRLMVQRMLESRSRATSSAMVDMPPRSSAPIGRTSGIGTYAADEGSGAVVVANVGNPSTGDGRRIVEEFRSMIGKQLPLTQVPDLAKARHRLIEAFPHAETVVDLILGELAGRRHVRLPPTLLVGRPGVGKTSFVVLLAEVLGVPFTRFDCGGVSDAGVIGTPRKWCSAEPSFPLSVIRDHQHAGPVILFDRLDMAAGSSSVDGSLLDGMTGFLEPDVATRWRDPYVQTPLNLSGVSWLATAYSVEPLPRGARDRFRILEFPQPKADHIELLAPRILMTWCEERGLDPRWAPPLQLTEIEALRRYWRGGSLRTLRQCVNAVLAVRARQTNRH